MDELEANFTDLKDKHNENQLENTFDEKTMELMKTIKESVPNDCDAIIILKQHSAISPIIFTQGHPFDTTAMAAQFVRSMKRQLLEDLDT